MAPLSFVAVRPVVLGFQRVLLHYLRPSSNIEKPTTNIFGLDKVWKWFKEKHEHRASISMSNVVVNPSYLNIAYLPEELKYIMYDKLLQIPDRSVWPKGSYHAQEIHYQTGIHAIRDGLQLEGVDEKDQEKYWQWFMRYTKDLDRLRGTDTFKFIKELQYYE